MKIFLTFLGLLFLFSASSVGAEPPSRFFYNDDGDRAIMLARGPFHPQQLYYAVDNLVGTGVTTLIYCANLGSDQAYYPSKVASALDWRMTESHSPDNPVPVFPRLYRVAKQLREAGVDVLGTVMHRARQMGLEFVPSLRMNDGHFGNNLHPTVHPLTGEFWMEHQDMTIGTIDPSLKGYEQYLLNFEHQEVRDFRMGQIYELIDGYAADGFEMDFSRFFLFFPPGHEKPELITEMVRKARQRLDAKNKKDGRNRFLIVRVAHSLERNRELGLDVPAWIKEGLVDYIVPSSPDRDFQFTIPVDEFIALAKGTGCRVVASPDSYGADGPRYRAAMANYFHMGQKDTYLFNFFAPNYPYTDSDYAILRDLVSPVTLWGRSKQFYAGDNFKDLELDLEQAGKPYTANMYVGEDLAECLKAGILKFAQLNIEFESVCPDDQFEIALNEIILPERMVERDQNGCHVELRNGPLPNVGWNTIAVTAQSFGSDAKPRIKRIHLKSDYDVSGGSYEYIVPEMFVMRDKIWLPEVDKPYNVDMYVEDDFDFDACQKAKILESVQLLIQIQHRHPEDVFEFLLNDHVLTYPKITVADQRTSYLFELKDGPLPKRRWNTVTVTAKTLNGKTNPYIRRVHLQTLYDLSARTAEK